jgi:ketosteroid isomerase-like protein
MMPCVNSDSGARAREFARHWIAAWNSQDLDAIRSHYAADVVLTSPVAVKILNHPAGTVQGAAAVRSYFQRGLEAYSSLRFELLDVMVGLSSLVLCFTNQNGAKTAEFMEFGTNGKVTRAVGNYNLP